MSEKRQRQLDYIKEHLGKAVSSVTLLAVSLIPDKDSFETLQLNRSMETASGHYLRFFYGIEKISEEQYKQMQD